MHDRKEIRQDGARALLLPAQLALPVQRPPVLSRAQRTATTGARARSSADRRESRVPYRGEAVHRSPGVGLIAPAAFRPAPRRARDPDQPSHEPRAPMRADAGLTACGSEPGANAPPAESPECPASRCVRTRPAAAMGRVMESCPANRQAIGAGPIALPPFRRQAGAGNQCPTTADPRAVRPGLTPTVTASGRRNWNMRYGDMITSRVYTPGSIVSRTREWTGT